VRVASKAFVDCSDVGAIPLTLTLSPKGLGERETTKVYISTNSAAGFSSKRFTAWMNAAAS